MPAGRFAFYVVTAAALALPLRSLVFGPPRLLVALVAFLVYGAFVLAGVFVLRLHVFVDAVVRGPEGARGVVLTFDDGPDPRTTPRVLAALDAAGCKGFFFVIGRKAEADPALVEEIVARGHGVGLHGYEHDRLFALRSTRRVKEDLERGLHVLEAITGKRPRLFRPPIGHTSPAIARVAADLGLTVVGWTAAGRDGLRGASPTKVLARIRRGLGDGAIVLLHDAAERGDFEPVAPLVLPELLADLDARRLDIARLEAWVDEPEREPSA